MNRYFIKQITIFFLMIILVSVCSCGADKGTPFSIENKTYQTITISINHDQLSAKMKPSEKRDFLTGAIPPSDAPWAPKTYLFEAKNEQGQIIYSKEFTLEELEEIKYEIVVVQQ
ncbi:MAG: hypothetical protein JXA46_00670 [Dehalococcoidales bacterium]|nr:hypothetical protein [Dehalococcoidales bacterium]